LDNLATIPANKPGWTPVVVNGHPLKSIHPYSNRRRAELQAHLPVGASSKRLHRLTDKLNCRLQYALHLASRRSVEWLGQAGSGTWVIGKNDGGKQEIHLGRRTHPHCLSIPPARWIDRLTYQAERVGIRGIVCAESDMSKGSFLDLEPMEKRETSLGRRVPRGLFISARGRRIQAEVNGSDILL
jgi:putative transposase